MKESYESRRVWNAHFSYLTSNGDKPAYLSTMVTLEASGALPQIGDANMRTDRIRQQELAPMMGVSRPTVTKRMSKIAAPRGCPRCNSIKRKFEKLAGEKLRCIECKLEFDPPWTAEDRKKASDKMKAVTAVHLHWQRAETEAQSNGSTHQVSSETTMENEPEGAVEAGPITRSRRSSLDPHPCILTRIPGFACANTYALAMPDEARPGLKAESDPTQHAAILAAHFGADVYDATARVNGWTEAWGWGIAPELPGAPDCSCRRQKSFEFQQSCTKCDGRGYTVGGSMSDFGRLLLHFLNMKGIDQEIRRCDGCKYSYNCKQAKRWPLCPRCEKEGRITSIKGEMTNWTQKRIADEIGLHLSTVRRYFREITRLNIVRTVTGKVWRLCCEGKLYDSKACPKCGNKCGAIKKREPWKIILLVSRTFDRDLVKAEQQRLEALLRLHRRWLELRQQEALAAAVALAMRVLGEWAGHEHQLMSFYHEMRRRLNTSEYARFINVLFPLNTS